MKIIDFARKGNVVRFYLGDDDCTEYCGDDWNDCPYNCNAGMVYSKYVKATRDFSFDFDSLVLEPCNGEYNCGRSKEDMKNRIVPCIVVIPAKIAEQSWHDDFAYWVGCDNAEKIYFGDKMEPEPETMRERWVWDGGDAHVVLEREGKNDEHNA